jgi:hypothetical protein
MYRNLRSQNIYRVILVDRKSVLGFSSKTVSESLGRLLGRLRQKVLHSDPTDDCGDREVHSTFNDFAYFKISLRSATQAARAETRPLGPSPWKHRGIEFCHRLESPRDRRFRSTPTQVPVCMFCAVNVEGKINTHANSQLQFAIGRCVAGASIDRGHGKALRTRRFGAPTASVLIGKLVQSIVM